MKIKFLKAFNGDSILIYFQDKEKVNRNILIDGGISATYKIEKGKKGKPEFGELKEVIDQIRSSGQEIDLLIITHIDDDHIGGILKWFDDDKDAYNLVKKVWFNSGSLITDYIKSEENKDLQHFINPEKSEFTSINQGIEFSKYISEKGIFERNIIIQGDLKEEFGLTFKFLSPNKQKLKRLLKEWKKKDPDLKTTSRPNDYSLSLEDHLENDKFIQDSGLPNGSSIAFILTYNDKNFLFLGDSHPAIIVKGLKKFDYSEENPIEAEFVKLAHHGSKKNTSTKLLRMINSNNYIISTNGKNHQHPHKKFIARLINEKNNCKIHFNYKDRMDMIFSELDRKYFPMFKAIAIEDDFDY